MKFWRNLAIFVAVVALAAGVIVTDNGATKAQDGELRATFDLKGLADEGALAGVDPSGATVTYWHQHSGAREERLNELIGEFNENNPWGITVEGSNQGSYGDIYQKIIAGLESGELPTLVVAYQNQALAYKQGGALTDMRIFVEDPLWGFTAPEQADFIPAFFDQDFATDGSRIGFPPNRSIEILYYNMDALSELGFDAPPTTWEEFREMAVAFTENGWSGYEGDDTIGYSIRTDASSVAALTYGLGGDIFDEAAGEYNYNNPETITALSFMQELLNDGYANLISERYGDQNDFAAGKNLFYMGSSSGLPFVQAAIDESGMPFNWGVTYVPYDEVPAVDIYGASVSILQGEDITAEEQLAAWLFVRWFTEPDQQAAWAEASNYFPVRISATGNLDAIFAEIPQYEQAWNLLLEGDGRTEPALASYDVVRDAAEQAFNTILTEGADVESTLEELDVEANAVLAEFQE